MRHGAKTKVCSSEGCTNQAQVGGVCRRHGAKVKLCRIEGCTNKAQVGGVCIRHGAKVKLCRIEGCTNQAKREGVCIRHGANLASNDESTAFGSELEKNAACHISHQSAASAVDPDEKSTGVPGDVIICENIAEL